jgi:pimeloyl-ACP methyl ester carboxylesterase
MDFEVNGYRMHYELYGDPDGDPLLWLHGWSGTGQDWKYIFKGPPSGFRLIGPDIRATVRRQVLQGHTHFANPRAICLTYLIISESVEQKRLASAAEE